MALRGLRPLSDRHRGRFILFAIMLAAFVLRLLLLQNEGHFRFPDEGRYKRATRAAGDLFNGDFGLALNRILQYDYHPGFAAVGLLPALIHRAAWEYAPASSLPWNEFWENGYGDYRLSSAIFAVPSVLAILMVTLMAREMGAGAAEALLAAFLLAASNSFFMYSQHFLPYDISLLFALGALLLVIRKGAAPDWWAIPAGMLAFLSFWIYNGYYALAIALAFIYCVFLAPSALRAILRAAGMILGGLLLFLPIYLYNLYALEIEIISELSRFSALVTHGDYWEGAVLPIHYFVQAEQGMAVVWAFGLALALFRLKGGERGEGRRRLRLWIVCLLFLYVIMSLMSNVLQVFVVYGRTARSLTPFIVLICAFAYARALFRLPPPARVLFLAAVSALAFFNFLPIMQQGNFRIVQRYVYENYDDVSFESTFGPMAGIYGIRGPVVESARYKLLNAGVYYPIAEIVERPAGEVILEYEHIDKTRAWQYEGMSHTARDLINDSDVKIWLIDTQGQPD